MLPLAVLVFDVSLFLLIVAVFIDLAAMFGSDCVISSCLVVDTCCDCSFTVVPVRSTFLFKLSNFVVPIVFLWTEEIFTELTEEIVGVSVEDELVGSPLFALSATKSSAGCNGAILLGVGFVRVRFACVLVICGML